MGRPIGARAAGSALTLTLLALVLVGCGGSDIPSPRVEARVGSAGITLEPEESFAVPGEADGFHLRFVFDQVPEQDLFLAMLSLQPEGLLERVRRVREGYELYGSIPVGQQLVITFGSHRYLLRSRTAPAGTVRLQLPDGTLSAEGGPVPVGEHRLRLDFSDPMERTSVQKALGQDLAPREVIWSADSRSVTAVYHLPEKKAVGVNTAYGLTRDGWPVSGGDQMTIWARGQASLWRLDPGGTPRLLAHTLDRFDSLHASPGGEILILYSTQEWGYTDFVKVFVVSPETGTPREAAIPVRDLQAPPSPRWWRGGALLAGLTWGVHQLDWDGNAVPAAVQTYARGLWMRGSGVSPAGQVAILVSEAPRRGEQAPVDLYLGEQVYTAVNWLPTWPENRGDTHYWPHVQVLWPSPDTVLFPELAAAFSRRNTWLRLDLQTGRVEPFPSLDGMEAAYPDPQGQRFLTRGPEGWFIVAPGREVSRIPVSDPQFGQWAPPAWSEDGDRIFLGPYNIDARNGQVTTELSLPAAARSIARDAAGRAFWIQPES